MHKKNKFAAALLATLVSSPSVVVADEPQTKQELKVTTVVIDDENAKAGGEKPTTKQQYKVTVVDENGKRTVNVDGDQAANAGQTATIVIDGKDGKAIRIGGEKSAKLWLGIGLKSIEGDLSEFLQSDKGVLIDNVNEKGPAAKAGLKRGDILLAVDGTELEGPAKLLEIMTSAKAGQELNLKIRRKDEVMELKVVPEPRPQDVEMTVDLSKEIGDGQFKFFFDPIQMEGFRLGAPTVITPGGASFKGNAVLNVVKDGKTTAVKIEREGEGPAKISVTKDDQTKEYTEEQLDQIPEEVRGAVQSMLNNKGAISFSSEMLNARKGAMVEAQKALEAASAGFEHSKALAEAFNSPEFKKHLDMIREQATSEVGAAAKKATEEAQRVVEKARARAERALDRDRSESAELAELRSLVAELKREIAELKAKSKQE
jgi:membrane-associated protease RseP (regulator of RpoE activity)